MYQMCIGPNETRILMTTINTSFLINQDDSRTKIGLVGLLVLKSKKVSLLDTICCIGICLRCSGAEIFRLRSADSGGSIGGGTESSSEVISILSDETMVADS